MLNGNEAVRHCCQSYAPAMLWIPATIVVGAALRLVGAQNPPPCAQSCLATTEGVLGCTVGDNACACSGNGVFNGRDVFFGCASTVCEEEDEDDAQRFFRSMCAAISSSASLTSGTPSTDGPPASSSSSVHNNSDNGSGSGKDGGGGGGGHDNVRSGSSPNVGAIVGGTIGGVVLLILLVLLYVLYRRRRARRYEEYEPSETDWHSDAPEAMSEARHVSQMYSDTVTHPAEYVSVSSPTTAHARESLLAGPSTSTGIGTGTGKGPMDDLTATQKDLVQMMLERGAAPSSVESVVERMRAENRGEADPPPQYEFLDAKGHLIITPSSPAED